MKSFFYGIHLIISIGGGFIGLTSFLSLEDIDGGIEIALVLLFAALYTTGIIGGIVFSLNKERKAMLKLYYFLQIPLFSSLVFSFHFLSALGLYVGYNLFQTKTSILTVGFHFQGLPTWTISWNQETPLALGINLTACLLLFLLYKMDYSTLEG